MTSQLSGIHHVTAFARDPRRNHDFYVRVLGLRLVKRTVNFDDPHTHHLYYGDNAGAPGTLLTHFPNPAAARGAPGSPEISTTVLTVPKGALPFWIDRLRALDIPFNAESTSGQDRVAFEDPDGMRIALVEAGRSNAAANTSSGIPAASAITGVESVVLRVRDEDETARFLCETLDFDDAGPSDGQRRLFVNEDAPGMRLELIRDVTAGRPRIGAGSVHHVAWRVPDEETQLRVAGRLREARVAVTPVLDRHYFKSIYFRIPDGVIFEVATDGPGFTVDEPAASLGTSLKLPPRFEARRDEIEQRLPPMHIHASN